MIPSPFIEKEGYIIYPDTDKQRVPSGDSLHIKSADIEGSLSFMKREGIKNIIINSGWGYDSDNIDFVKNNVWIEGISIENEGMDISAINALTHLKHIAILTKHAAEIDCSNFPELITCLISYRNKISNLDQCVKLKYLMICEYSQSDLTYFAPLANIEFLTILEGKIVSLDGIENMSKLKELELWHLVKLRSAASLTRVNKSLKRLYLYGNKNFHDYAPIASLTELEYLNILRGGPAASVDFILPLEKLKIAGMNINVLDGNLRPCIERNVVFKDYRHFSHKSKEVRSKIKKGA